MVIIRIRAGLGNQLFQYAAGRALAHRNQVPLKLDLSWFERKEKRRYRLDRFAITASVASPGEIARTGVTRRGVRGFLTRLWNRRRLYYKRPIFIEQHYHYDPNIWQAPKNVYLIGHWQSEKYFCEIEGILREELCVKHSSGEDNRAMQRLIEGTEAVSLHIRRGDYVSNPYVHSRFCICSLSYYYAAIEVLGKTLPDPHFFVFSDDVQWVKENLHLEHPTRYIDHNGPGRDFEDLRLMSFCKHHIIANSTFSWWGAWLSADPEKIVIAPRHWFKDAKRCTRDLIPGTWIRV